MQGFGSGQPEGTHGPHGNRLANAADPRIDSDRDHRAAPGHTAGLHQGHTTGLHEPGHNVTGVHEPGLATGTHEGAFATTGANRGFDGPATKTDGPHNSNLMNKVDPRVDSDRDHSRNMGMNPHGTATTGTGRTPHESTLGSSTTTHGTTHNKTHGVTEGSHGPHSSRMANAADPRIDSDRDHRAAPNKTTATAGGLSNTRTTGPAPNTAGPHKSDIMNKLDPRVDSDLDGSKTVGGNKTFTR